MKKKPREKIDSNNDNAATVNIHWYAGCARGLNNNVTFKWTNEKNKFYCKFKSKQEKKQFFLFLARYYIHIELIITKMEIIFI